MSATTEIIARAVIRRDNQLLVARQLGKSWYFLPGGHVEPGENVETALVRELAEELNTDATITAFAGAAEHRYTENATTRNEINLVFDVTLTETNPVSQEEHLEVHWLPLDQLINADLRPRTIKTALVTTANTRTPFWRGVASGETALP